MQPNPALIAVLNTLLIVLRGWVAAMELASLAPGNPHDAEKRQGLLGAIRAAERLLAAVEAQSLADSTAQSLADSAAQSLAGSAAQRDSCPAPVAARPAGVLLPCTARIRRRALRAAPNPCKPTARATIVATIIATIRRAIPLQGTGPPPHPA